MKSQFTRQLVGMTIAARQTFITNFLLSDIEQALIRIKEFIFCESDIFYQSDIRIASRKHNPFLRTCEIQYKLVNNIPRVSIGIRIPSTLKLLFSVYDAEYQCERFAKNYLLSTPVVLTNFCIF
jgi:hypothetical protein